MAASGNPFDGPNACPFVALENDRDRRSERPDYRHRCFAEATPAPRSIAHQETYCLSPNFSGCPIFQDWALRAAARPVGSAGAPASDASPSDAALAGLAALGGAAAAEPSIDDELPPLDEATPSPPSPLTPLTPLASAGADQTEDEPEIDAAPPLTAAPDVYEAPEQQFDPAVYAWDTSADTEQLAAFDEPGAQSSLPGALTAHEEPPDVAEPPGYVPPPAQRDDPKAALPEEVAVPAFLAGRAAAQPQSSLPPPQSVEQVTREDLVPSWQIDGRYGAEPPDDGGRGGSRFDSILTAIAVIAILALGVAGVLLLPGLLSGGGGPARTPRPSIVVPSNLPSAEASATFGATTAPQTAQPTDAATADPNPAASPRFYRIRNGDTLARIARRFDITVEELLAANPDITDANRILVGQLIIIPQ